MLKKIIVVVMILCVSGCGTVYHGKTQTVEIVSYPQGLTAEMAGKQCITPCKLEEVPRKASKIALKDQAGETYFYDVDHDFNAGASILGNWWNYVVIGLAVDLSTGGAYEIKPISIRVEPLLAKIKQNTTSKTLEPNKESAQKPIAN